MYENVATNDCYASFKYTHEFVTNYDFDELIFPRRIIPTRNISNISQQLSCPTTTKSIYSLYNYITDLIRQVDDNNSKKISFLSFEHMLFFDHIPESFLTQLDNAIRGDETKLLKFVYKESSELNGTFEFNSDLDMDYAKMVMKSKSMVKCLNKTISNLALKFNRVEAIWLNRRKGKSVFNTKYVELINQHYAQQINEDAIKLNVPVDLGFVNHYREKINSPFFRFKYQFNEHFKVDIESYYFLASIFSR